MEDHSITIFFFTYLILLLSNCVALDTIYANQQIKDGQTIISGGEMFECGFFSPGKSQNRYVGIWYKNISKRSVIWVANRETPISDTSGTFIVSRNGNLMILGANNTLVWSSNTIVRSRSYNPLVVVQLLDTGNLVVWDRSNIISVNKNMIWQSFDYPGDTLVAGMKIGKDLDTGLERVMTSWKSPDDPSIGLYNIRVETNGYPQIYGRKGEFVISRFGPWNGIGYSGFPLDEGNRLSYSMFVTNEKEIYYKFELKSSVVQRNVLTSDGKTHILHWIERIQDWIVYGDLRIDSCDRYQLCGPYGVCSINKHPPCICMQGFEPRNRVQWDASDWSSGCQRKKPLNCSSGDGFRKTSGVKLPDTRWSWYNHSMTLGECEMACRKNCSCTAYANLDIRGSGCLLWFGELMDVREYDEHHDIYIRVAAFELQGYTDSQSDVKKTKEMLRVVILPSSVVLLILAVAYASMKKKKRPHMKEGSGVWEDLDDLQFFSLWEVAQATSNFSVSNKIGEGGFGPVYKGELLDGQEVAVKRLSETSLQGLEEFKNEVICIAKLQHRNLVKLLGYCIHESEKILIYEYMSNKSLDSFLFDETRSLILDWPKRFHIIHGIARGILYLHQDSRLQIIHRDIKASNILLDADMNPKISDFGLARKFVRHDTTTNTNKVVGTYGYISPEYALHGHFSTKSDIYSFGVLVLEIVSGKKNKEFYHEDHGDNLLGHAWKLYKEGRSIELLSVPLRSSSVIVEVLRSIHVALLCVQHHAEDRPTMLSVVLMLVSEGALPEPKQPAFFNGKSCYELRPLPSVDECTITLVHAR